MHSKLLRGVAIAFLAVSPAMAGGGKITWTNAASGLADAKNTGRPILMYFTADW